MYQAPEQMDELKSYSKAADLWAVGMIIYEMVTKGGHPILGADIHKNVKITAIDYKKRMDKFDMTLDDSDKTKYLSDFAKNLI